jgi:hypothetical protein
MSWEALRQLRSSRQPGAMPCISCKQAYSTSCVSKLMMRLLLCAVALSASAGYPICGCRLHVAHASLTNMHPHNCCCLMQMLPLGPKLSGDTRLANQLGVAEHILAVYSCLRGTGLLASAFGAHYARACIL